MRWVKELRNVEIALIEFNAAIIAGGSNLFNGLNAVRTIDVDESSIGRVKSVEGVGHCWQVDRHKCTTDTSEFGVVVYFLCETNAREFVHLVGMLIGQITPQEF